MRDHRNPHGANAQELKEQKLADDLLLAEFQWNDAKTIEDKKRALAQVNLAMGEIEKFEASRKDNKKPNLYFDVDPSLIPTMMQEMEARIIRHERLQNWQNPEWMDRQAEEFSNLKEIGYSESEAEKYIEYMYTSGYSPEEIENHVHQWDNQSWAEQRG
jgi:hypothetical protein